MNLGVQSGRRCRLLDSNPNEPLAPAPLLPPLCCCFFARIMVVLALIPPIELAARLSVLAFPGIAPCRAAPCDRVMDGEAERARSVDDIPIAVLDIVPIASSRDDP